MNRLQLRHILCPVDLASPSMRSLHWASAMARARGAQLTAFHVVATEGLGDSGSMGASESGDLMMKLRDALVADAEDASTGAAYGRRVAHGSPTF